MRVIGAVGITVLLGFLYSAMVISSEQEEKEEWWEKKF